MLFCLEYSRSAGVIVWLVLYYLNTLLTIAFSLTVVIDSRGDTVSRMGRYTAVAYTLLCGSVILYNLYRSRERGRRRGK